MKTFIAALHITTAVLSLEELSKILGEPGLGSHDKGGARANSPRWPNFWQETTWKVESSCDEAAPLEEHLTSLEQRLIELAAVRDQLPEDARLRLDIAVFYDTAYGSISLPHAQIKEFIAQGLDIEITAYGDTKDSASGGE